jgi:hypothetical protein
LKLKYETLLSTFAFKFKLRRYNLVATQVRLSREHANRAVFTPEHGLDPTLDVSLVGRCRLILSNPR